MATSIFTSQVPVVTDGNDGVAYSLGTVFNTSVDGFITHIRWRFPDTLPSGTVTGALYVWDSDATGTLLTSSTFTAPVAGTWNTTAITPQPVGTSASYVAVVHTPDRYVATTSFFTSALTNAPLTAVQDTPSQHNGKLSSGPALQYPQGSFSASCYFVDVVFTTGAQDVDLGLIETTETVFNVASLKTISLDNVVTSDVAFPVTAVRSELLGLVTTSEIVTGLAVAKSAPIGLVSTADIVFPIVAAQDKTITLGLVSTNDSVFPPTIRQAVDNSFPTGPCEVWEPIWCSPLSTEAQAVTGEAVDWATQVLWQLSGQRFGFCTVTLRPCRAICADDRFGFNDWWPGVGNTPIPGRGGGPRPWWFNGLWYNVCNGSCGDPCSCTFIDSAPLPAPTRSVIEVKLDGAVMDPSLYRVDENRWLVRTDGELWPMCQDMAAPDTADNTWSVTIVVGEEVPLLGRRAVGELAAEFAKDCVNEPCRLSPEVRQLSRQGVNITFVEGGSAEGEPYRLGLKISDLFVGTYNPNSLARRGRTYDIDDGASPWRRTFTT